MLWNVIFEFYVMYIFGGVLKDVTTQYGYKAYGGILGRVGFNDNYNFLDTGFNFIKFQTYANGVTNDVYMPLGNYFSLIATIITLIVILLLSWKLIKAIFNICAKVI